MRNLDAAMRCGAAFIAEQQRADGSFESFVCAAPDNFAHAAPLPTAFPNSAILAALNTIDTPLLKAVRSRSAEFLLTQKSDSWSFNYWHRSSREYREQPYPDDLDDTFCALAALQSYDTGLLSGVTLAAAAHMLIATEQQPGGPYRTWLADVDAKGRWGDIDLAVNANVGWFLSFQRVSVPGVILLIERAIRKHSYTSPYYPDDTITLYFIARWYRGKRQPELHNTLGTRLEVPESNSPLRTALLVSSLVRLGAGAGSCAAAVRRLLAQQQPNGSWPAFAFCLDSARTDKARYIGSPALTTALCLEALTLYARVATPSVTLLPSDVTHQRTMEHARQLIGDIAQPDLRRSVNDAVRRVLASGNERQIILLPHLIAAAADVRVSATVLHQLATANLFGWAAYTVCDDILDGEREPTLLPGAAACLHRMHITLQATLPGNRAFHEEIQRILDRTDAANAWEMAHCRGEIRENRLYIHRLPRYGNYWQLADRSLGHTIAGLGVLYAAGLSCEDSSLSALRNFFRHYLIARQLNDDAHDWEDDLRHGHINAAGTLILGHWLEQTGNSVAYGIPLETAREALQNNMWERVIDQISEQIRRHTTTARRALRKTGFDNAPFEAMLQPLDAAVGDTLSTRQKTLDFLANL